MELNPKCVQSESRNITRFIGNDNRVNEANELKEIRDLIELFVNESRITHGCLERKSGKS